MNFLRKNLGEIILGIVLCGLLSFLMQINLFSGTADNFDFGVFGYQEKSPGANIIIVGLDDATINNPNFKSYPEIDRGDYIKVIKNILPHNPSVIALDTFFFNPSENAEDDSELAKLFQENDNLIAANEWLADEKRLLNPLQEFNIPPDQLGYVNVYSNSANEKNLINKVEVHFDPKTPYSTENEPLMFKTYRALSSGRQMAYFDKENQNYIVTRGGEETVIPIQNNGIGVNFYGKPHSFREISFYDVWTGNIDPQFFENKIVLVGATASDIHDEFFTPVSLGEFMPGVEFHANFLQTILEKDFLIYQTNAQKILTVALVFLLLLVIFAYGNLALHFVLSLLLALGFYVFAIFSYRHGFLFSYFWPVIMIFLYWTGAHTIRFIRSEKTKKEIRQAFSKYVAKDVVDEILKNPNQINLGGEARNITVFFSDLVNFTNLSEKLSPLEVNKMINTYLSEMSAIILKEKGTIDKYMGDAVMAYWGAPLPCPDHAFLTCRTALLQREALPAVNQKLEAQNLPKLDMRIGIASGSVIAGNVGTAERMEYTVIGDDVNLASRLESINKQYGTRIAIAENTYELVKEKFFTRELDSIRVKGKDRPIQIHELICEKNAATPAQKTCKENYENGLLAYRAQNWDTAEKYFVKNQNDPASKIMQERITELRKTPLSKNWDGVHTFSSK